MSEESLSALIERLGLQEDEEDSMGQAARPLPSARVPKLETEPGLLNQVTATALSAASQFLDLPRPDHTAARMAFKASYDRLVEQEKLAGRAPKYWPSPGGTHEEFEAVKEEGVRLGLLPVEFAPHAAPQLGNSTPPPGAMEALRSIKPKSLPAPNPQDYLP